MSKAAEGAIHFAWLDANIYTKENEALLARIRSFNEETMEFIEEEACHRFLGRGVADPRRFIFIVSGGLGERLVPSLHDRENILSIFVYCGNLKYHQAWSAKYPKVRVVNTADDLIHGLQSDRQRYQGS